MSTTIFGEKGVAAPFYNLYRSDLPVVPRRIRWVDINLNNKYYWYVIYYLVLSAIYTKIDQMLEPIGKEE